MMHHRVAVVEEWEAYAIRWENYDWYLIVDESENIWI